MHDSLIEKVTFNLKGDSFRPEDIWRKTTSGRKNIRGKIPLVGVRLAFKDNVSEKDRGSEDW